MNQSDESITQKLFEKELITSEQFQKVKNYRDLGIFSLHNELLSFLYLAVLLFTSGIGILIYKNIDTIGHTIILAILLIVTAVCFYFCFKKALGFEKGEVVFENPIYDYLVLLSTILSCIFIGYIQYQYDFIGVDWSTLLGCVVSFFCAYYFDNKSSLSIAITGLATYIGITVTPKSLLENEIYSNPTLSYYGLALGVLIIIWNIYSNQISLKKHFNLVYLTFAQHLIGICCIAGLLEDYWYAFTIVLALFLFYFYKISHELKSISLFVFTLIYGYIGLNILVFKIGEFIDLSNLASLLTIITPAYFIGSIVGFIYLIKQFKKGNHDRF